jgi:hypothetical protein
MARVGLFVKKAIRVLNFTLGREYDMFTHLCGFGRLKFLDPTGLWEKILNGEQAVGG